MNGLAPFPDQAHPVLQSEQAGLAAVGDAVNGAEAGAIVAALHQTVLHKLVVLDVTLHLLPAGKQEVSAVLLPRAWLSGRVWRGGRKHILIEGLRARVV